MTTFNLNCEAVEATLAEYLDETLEPWVRTAIEEHLAGCTRCTILADELRNIAREIAALPPLFPERDVWQTVAARIGVPGNAAEPVEQSSELDNESFEPVEESTPAGPETERVVFASDSFLPIRDESKAPEEALVVPTEAPLVMGDLGALTSERLSATEPSLPTREPPAPTMELAAETPEAPPVTKEPPLPNIEPASVTRELPVEIPAPVTLTSEPPIRPRAAPTITTAPADAVATREKRWGPLQIGLAAAALVLVTATTSSLLTVKLLGRPATPSVATTGGTAKASSSDKPRSTEKPPTSETAPVDRIIRGESSEPAPVEPDLSTRAPAAASALTVSNAAPPTVTRSPEEAVYDREINALSRILRRKKSRLEASTVTVIDNNLRAVDAASAEIRAALEDDPSNALLDAQASRALEMKVELLRRAAMMRSGTSL